ncbi:hypothetical protein [Cellulomonas soli]|uniref:hypothetical protein n=1 Tax=Cellulomonas soli TaxID=931535 RepID=UPI0016622E8A|nr:hypothetical protein [Cellulomonas soli]
MNKRVKLSTLAAGVAALMAVVSLAPAATAAESVAEPLPPAAINNPDVPLETIEALPEVIQNDPDVIIDPELELGPIVYPNGTPVEGQSARMTAAAWSCGGTAQANVFNTWGPASVGDCTVWGSAGWTQGYTWTVEDLTKSVCVQVRGFNSSGTRTWYGGGCGFSNAGFSVPWGNVLSNPAVRAQSLAVVSYNSVPWHI